MLEPCLIIFSTAHVVRIKFPGVQIAAYADDIGVYAASMHAKLAMTKAQEASQAISEALREDGLHVHPKTTDAVLLSVQQGNRGNSHKTFKNEQQELPL